MATVYRQVAHGEASFPFSNDSETAIAAGSRLKVGDLLFYTKHIVPGYDKTQTVGENIRMWTGVAYLLLHANAKIIEATLDAPLGADYTWGQAVTIDLEHVGYAVPHPGPHVGDQGNAPPPILDDATIVANTADNTIRFIAIPTV